MRNNVSNFRYAAKPEFCGYETSIQMLDKYQLDISCACDAVMVQVLTRLDTLDLRN